MPAYLRHIAGFVLILLLAVPATGQDFEGNLSRRGTAGAAHLRIPVTARMASLGLAGTAGGAGMSAVEGLAVNPAILATNTGTSLLISRMDYLVDTGINTIGLAQRVGGGHLGLMITAWDFGEIPKQTEYSPEITNLTFSPTILTAGASYARLLSERVAVGFTFKLTSENIDDMVATAAAIDGGVTYGIPAVGLLFGLSVRNIGTKLKYGGAPLSRIVQLPDQRPDASAQSVAIESEPADLPTMMNFGVTWTRSVSDELTFSVLANYRSNSFDQDQFAFGVDVGLLNILSLRGSYDLVGDKELTLFSGSSVGAGLKAELAGVDFYVDYAYRPTTYFSNVQILTVVVTL